MPKRKKLISHPPETSTPATTMNSTPELSVQTSAKQSRPTEVKLPDSQGPQEPRFVPSKDFLWTYANHVFFKPSTIWDMSIVFGEVSRAEDQQLVVENRVSITMPIAVAKLLAIGIEANLQQYKKLTGKDVELPSVTLSEVAGGPLTPIARVKQPAQEE